MNKTDYIKAHTHEPAELLALREKIKDMHNAHMICGPEVAAYLMGLVASIQAKEIFEVGCFVGYSTLAMSIAAPSAHITTCDLSPGPLKIAKETLKGRNVEICEMDALDALETITKPLDLAFIDGNKAAYPLYLEEILPYMRPYGIMVFDNCWWYGKVVEPKDEASKQIDILNKQLMNDNRVLTHFLEIGDGIHTAVVLPTSGSQ